MIYHNFNSERGFVAIMSVVIISAILLILVFTLGISSFFNRFDVFDTENKRISLALAEACVNIAMIKIAQNPSYTPISGGECVGVSDTCGAAGATRTCRICEVTTAGGNSTILARAVYKSAYSNVRVVGALGGSNFVVSDWSEIATYSGVPCPVP